MSTESIGDKVSNTGQSHSAVPAPKKPFPHGRTAEDSVQEYRLRVPKKRSVHCIEGHRIANGGIVYTCCVAWYCNEHYQEHEQNHTLAELSK